MPRRSVCSTVTHCCGSAARTWSAPLPTTTQIFSIPAFRHQSVTQLIIGLNRTSAITFGYLDFILVPCPAARMIALVARMTDHSHFGLMCALPFSLIL